MAVSIDGTNLVITLEPGVTSVEWIDVYSDWKRWVADGTNSKYPPAFRTIGGDPLSTVVNAGAYFFLRNDLGWRLKPPEEDITIFVSGNLALEDLASPGLIATTGAFSTAVLGLQPVTQGVTQELVENLRFAVFQNSVAIDPLNATGRAVSGTGIVNEKPVGTREQPVDNITDAKAIADELGIKRFQLLSNINITENIDLSLGYNFQGDSPFIMFSADPLPNLSNCSLNLVTVMNATLDGLNVVREANVINCFDANGFFEKCAFGGSIDFNGNASIFESYSNIPGLGSPVFSISSGNLIIRDFKGSLRLRNMNQGIHSVGTYEGRIIIDNTVNLTPGMQLHLRGDPFGLVNNAIGDLNNLFDETESKRTRELHTLAGLDPDNPLQVTDTSRDAGDISQTITDDGTTSTVTRQ